MQGWMGEQPGQPGGAAPGAAGDHQDAHAQAQASASNAHASAHSAAQAAAQDAHSAAHAAAQAAQAAEEAFAAAGMPEGSGEEYLQRVGDFVAAALDPLGIDVQVDVETPGGQRTTVKPSAKTDKAEEEDKQDKAASPEAAKEGSPSSSDDEEWTVLSDKKPEAEAVQIPIQVLDKEVAPVYPTLPAEESASKPGAKYTEAEFQQLLMGLKREHKEAVEKMRKEQDEALFKVGFPLQVTHWLYVIQQFSWHFQIVQELVLLRLHVSCIAKLWEILSLDSDNTQRVQSKPRIQL